ncbi:flavodoxin family protein [Methylophilus sp. 3sh_L]|jgi:multimeric flavodoxin WrbA|uniref:flavodoxin family protein n=1 Tax=Methylophilus sp. 3sh_L TaxID=3377114 RepID=UPI00398ECC92
MTQVSIVYHSGYGHTAEQAKAVARGAQKVEGVTVNLLTVDEAQQQWELLKASDAIIFGSPTYMGSASGQFKTFMDASSKAWYTRDWKDKIAAGFTTSASQSGDKLSTLIQLAVFAAQHGMIWVGQDLLPGNNNSNGSVNDLNRLGSFLGAMAQANADQGPDLAPIQSDLLTAEHLGERVATVAQRFTKAA